MKPKLKYVFLTILVFTARTELSVYAQDATVNLENAKKALRTGNYREARNLFQPFLEDTSQSEREFILDYFETFLALGEYDKGLDEVQSLLSKHPDDPYLLHMKGRFLVVKGEYKDAEQSFIDAAMIDEEFLRNLLELGELLEKTGGKNTAQRIYQQIIRIYQQNRLRTAQAIAIAGKSFAKLGDYHEANRVFGIAYDLDATSLQNLSWWADLFREKFNATDAQRTYEEALSINPHSAELLVGYARSFESLAQWELLANQAIEENPNCVEALNLLAEIHILDGVYDEAETLLKTALEINSVHELSLANLATIYHLRGEREAFEEIEQTMLDINPLCSDFYLTLAENCMRRFRYMDTVAFCQKAIQREYDNWQAYTLLGSNILRVGKIDEARRYLDIAYEQDPFNIYAHNTLELIDEYEDFTKSESEHFTLLIHNSENAVLSGPILALAEECYDSLKVRYPYNPDGEIRIEAYNDHDDFAVRISGLPGIGLLGVCFGDIVAFDTPRAQMDNNYNWSMTLWHEIAHVMALGQSDNRVPRWFTEGLSVYEERKARPEWRREMELELFVAFDQDVLLSLKDINKGFTRPKYNEQVIITYYQSAKMIEFLVNNYGFTAIIEFLEEFGKGSDLIQAFQTVLGESPEEFEKKFFDNLKRERETYALVLSDLPPILSVQQDDKETIKEKLLGKSENPFFKKVKEGYNLLNEKRFDEAEQKFLEAIDIFPYYTMGQNPYRGLAEIYRKQGYESKLIDIIEDYLAITNYGAVEARELAQLYEKNGELNRAKYYYQRSMQVEPYDLTAHTHLAELYARQESYASESDERKIILALNPLDRAQAHYNLALSLYNNRQIQEAKAEILKSLEFSPGFRDAQKLLLMCVEK